MTLHNRIIAVVIQFEADDTPDVEFGLFTESSG
jgi:hypothetical protein